MNYGYPSDMLLINRFFSTPLNQPKFLSLIIALDCIIFRNSITDKSKLQHSACISNCNGSTLRNVSVCNS